MSGKVHDLRSLADGSRKWLLDSQDPGSGGWAEHPGGRLSSLNTAEAIIALIVSGVEAGDPSISKAVAFLYRDRPTVLPPNEGCWARSAGTAANPRVIPDLVRTSVAISALVKAGEGPEVPAVRKAIEWVIDRQNRANDDTGWSNQRGAKSKVIPTCFALVALMRLTVNAGQNEWREQIQRGLDQLTGRFRKPNSSFGDGASAAIHTIHAVLVLQSARECAFNVPPDAERKAIDWLLEYQDEALAPVEEIIDIDPEGDADYGFIFPNEALLIRVLGGSDDSRHRNTRLWNDVQRGLSLRYDERSYGFYGQRVFSWSTAAGLNAIASTERHLTSITARPAEDVQGGKVGNAILVFAVLLTCVVTYLSVSGKFKPLTAMTFVFLMLACLVAYRLIGETTFKQLVMRILPRSNRDDD
jgi:hypothetical protein